MRSLRLATVAVGVAVTIPMAGAAFAAPAPDLNKSEVKAWTFVGKAGACGTDYAAGTRIVESRWLPHAGLVDAKGKADKALSLSKQGDTADCSSAGASITKVAGLGVTELGYDISDDSHCGAGAPRFNVTTTDGTFFFGCAAMASSPLSTTGWSHKTVDTSSLTGTVQSIDIVFDEGTDQGSGSALLDNIEVNGIVVGD
jgi:hypothetical protein